MSIYDLSMFTRDDLVWLPLDQVEVRDGFEVFRGEDEAGEFKQAYDTLDEWLPSARAAQMHSDGQILTTVAMHGDHPVAFIATHAYSLHDSHEGAKTMTFTKPYSALKVLHLAVAKDYARFGIATEALNVFGIGAAATMNLFTGCRFVYLDALKPAMSFYKRKSFIELPMKKAHPFFSPMLFDLAASPSQFAQFRQLGEQYVQARAAASRQ